MRKILLTMAILIAAAYPCVAQEASLSVSDAQALAAMVRGAPLPNQLPITEDNLPLIVTLYTRGGSIEKVIEGPDIRQSIENIHKELTGFLEHLPEGKSLLQELPMTIDTVRLSGLLQGSDRLQWVDQITPGIDGLLLTKGEQKTYLTPLAILKNLSTLDPVRAAYVEQVSTEPPEGLLARRLRVIAYVEQTSGANMAALFRGNVLQGVPTADQAVQSLFYGGIWLLRTQQQDGSLMPLWLPVQQEAAQVSRDPADTLKCVIALQILSHLSDDEQFANAAERALRPLMEARQGLRQPPNERTMLYVPLPNDEVTASALMLQALYRRAAIEGAPTADRRMVALGDFIALMTGPDGRLYAKSQNAREDKPPFLVRGGPYAEALIALSLLQQIEPSETRKKAADRLANLVLAQPPDIQFFTQKRSTALVIEALVEYYKLTRSERHGTLALALVQKLVEQQHGEKAEWPDYAGGFAEGDLPPDTLTTAAAASAISSAYELSLLMRRTGAEFAAPAQRAAQFLRNMQYRTENAFFLRDLLLVEGAYRRSPVDLAVQGVVTAEAVRAMAGVATILAETLRPEGFSDDKR